MVSSSKGKKKIVKKKSNGKSRLCLLLALPLVLFASRAAADADPCDAYDFLSAFLGSPKQVEEDVLVVWHEELEPDVFHRIERKNGCGTYLVFEGTQEDAEGTGCCTMPPGWDDCASMGCDGCYEVDEPNWHSFSIYDRCVPIGKTTYILRKYMWSSVDDRDKWFNMGSEYIEVLDAGQDCGECAYDTGCGCAIARGGIRASLSVVMILIGLLAFVRSRS